MGPATVAERSAGPPTKGEAETAELRGEERDSGKRLVRGWWCKCSACVCARDLKRAEKSGLVSGARLLLAIFPIVCGSLREQAGLFFCLSGYYSEPALISLSLPHCPHLN